MSLPTSSEGGETSSASERIAALIPGINHRADTLQGTGSSIAAHEIRHIARLLQSIVDEPEEAA